MIQIETIASAIHYPECWDIAVYPTLEDALSEIFAWFSCTNDDCLRPDLEPTTI